MGTAARSTARSPIPTSLLRSFTRFFPGREQRKAATICLARALLPQINARAAPSPGKSPQHRLLPPGWKVRRSELGPRLLPSPFVLRSRESRKLVSVARGPALARGLSDRPKYPRAPAAPRLPLLPLPAARHRRCLPSTLALQLRVHTRVAGRPAGYECRSEPSSPASALRPGSRTRGGSGDGGRKSERVRECAREAEGRPRGRGGLHYGPYLCVPVRAWPRVERADARERESEEAVGI
jgi:hypothetical protein